MVIDTAAAPLTGRGRAALLAVVAVFFAIFLYSAAWTLVDPSGARADTEGLGFPGWAAVPLGVVKLVGLAVIAWGRSRLLTGLAFAGFSYDVVLALSAHLADRDPAEGALALVAVVATAAAYFAQRRLRDGLPR